jgi:hypothetical protein
MDNQGYDHDMAVRNNNQSKRKELEVCIDHLTAGI